MSDEIKSLVTGNSIYQANYARWKFLYDSYVGGEVYREGSYLTRYQLETDQEYKARLNATPLDNQCASVISVYNSFLFRETPEREFNGIQNLPELEDFLKDADFEGRSFDNFMKEVSTWSKVFGHSWILVSKANIDAVTRADEIVNGLRPYLSVLTPLVVLDWKWERLANGRYDLVYLKYVEEVNGDIQTIKEWTKELIVTSVADANNFTLISKEEEINQLGLIPAVIAYNNRSIVRGLGISAINDIADMQRFIYNCTSEVDQSIRLDSHPSLVKTQDTMAGVGAGAIIQMPENLDPALKPYILDFAGANIDNIYTSINNTIQAIEKIATIGSVRATETKTMSGVAMETEFQLLNARLSEMADNLELSEEGIWRLFCMYQGQNYDAEIEYPGSFAIRDTDREVARLKQMKEVTSDPVLLKEIDRQLALLLDIEDYEPEEPQEVEMNDTESEIIE